MAGDVRLDDLHDFDLVRTNGAVDFTLRMPELPTMFVGYRLYERGRHDVHRQRRRRRYVPRRARRSTAACTSAPRAPSSTRSAPTSSSSSSTAGRSGASADPGPEPGDAPGLDPDDGSTLTRYDARAGRARRRAR